LEMYKGFRHQICPKDATIADMLVAGASIARGKIVIPAANNIVPQDLWDSWIHKNVIIPQAKEFLTSVVTEDLLPNIYTVIDNEPKAE